MDYDNTTEDRSLDWLQAELDETLDDMFEMEFIDFLPSLKEGDS